MEFNGETYTKNYLRHADLLQGGTIQIEMADTPNKQRGITPEDKPYSFSDEGAAYV